MAGIIPVSILLILLSFPPFYGFTEIDLPTSCSQAIAFPHLTIKEHVTPYGNVSAGRFSKEPSAHSLEACVEACCNRPSCEVVFSFNNSCFLITCHHADLCQPLPREGHKFDHSLMVTVRIPGIHGIDHDWDSIEKSTLNYLFEGNSDTSLLDSIGETGEEEEEQPFPEETPSLSSSSTGDFTKIQTCIYGLEEVDCPLNEVCQTKNHRARQGLCTCKEGFQRDKLTHRCIPAILTTPSLVSTKSPTVSFPAPLTTEESMPNSTEPLHHLVVSAGENVTIQLPDNSVTLSAFALPKPPEGEKYKYEWKLLSHPDGLESGTMEDQNTDSLKLSKLREGIYTFKVTVVGKDATGEATVNVTVIPPKRVNQPPIAIIQPSNATVKLPNKDTVLDGSFSRDDDKIVKYHWEAVNVPIGYQPHLADSPTLQLTNLIPGSYKFMLTVVDSDGISNSTYANLTVLKEMDYPPTANAGPDVVIYLPQREVILNGNLSSDDKGIKAWEWTKSPDVDKPVDLEGTNTPYLHISQLEVGVYKFELKVTDTADQTSSAEVHVFVKPESNTPPTADAGPDQRVTLPLESPVILDGSHSHDDQHIARWFWEQAEGPKKAIIQDSDKPKAKISGLIPGKFVFKLTVYDDKDAHSESTVNVLVTLTANSPPRANAGGDQTVLATNDVVILNGSLSSDDVGIVSYHWTRDPSSLAVGIEIENSASSPILKLTNLIPGRYLYRLTVTDSQGETSSDTASLIVKSPDNLLDHVELVVNADLKSFTQGQLESVLKQLALLLHEWDPVHIKLIHLVPNDVHSNRVTLVFVVEKEGTNQLVPGIEVVATLRRKLKTDSNLLDMELLSIDTVVCQNECSGHGSCDLYTKKCVCKTFWMENIIRAKLGDKKSNCEWSILYVILIPLIILMLVGIVVWVAFLWCGPRWKFALKKNSKRLHRYTLLEEASDREKGDGYHLNLKGSSIKLKTSLLNSSDSDSDVVYDKVKPNRLANGHLRNGLVRDLNKVKA